MVQVVALVVWQGTSSHKNVQALQISMAKKMENGKSFELFKCIKPDPRCVC